MARQRPVRHATPYAEVEEREWRADPRWPGDADERPRRLITPLRVTLALALMGSIAFMAYAITVRDELQVPLLASGAAVLGIVFAAAAIVAARATWSSGREDRGRAALGYALAGGIAAIVASGALAAALIFALLWRPPS